MDAVAGDFRDAEYGRQEIAWGWPSLPTAKRSVSAWVFILVGALCGCWAAAGLDGGADRKERSTWHAYHRERPTAARVFLYAWSVAAGAWAGRWSHSLVRSVLGAGPEPPQVYGFASGDGNASAGPGSETAGRSPADRIVECLGCRQKLRVPTAAGLATCPRCGNRFECGPK